MTVYLNGVFLPRAKAQVSVDDRGFLFGDGVYEVTRARDGRLFEPGRHLGRLTRGLYGLGIAWPTGLDGVAIQNISERLLRENELETGAATVYLQITRGAAERRHAFPPPDTAPTVFLAVSRLAVPDEIRSRGASVITTPDLRWGRCDLKTINLLPNVLAKQQAVSAGAFEAILVCDGVVTEGASSNVFAVVDGTLRTHPATERILAGITREVVLELARELGLRTRDEALPLGELRRASEVMITATTADVMPVVQVDKRPVGDGQPGPVARALQTALRARMAQVPVGTVP
ncbi:MAG TPA: D-amino acid aminotransferase [Gemmatimonadales bacterium]|nr:D-amino acid aminotransferase [Gemmatimonadales bacterium]